MSIFIAYRGPRRRRFQRQACLAARWAVQDKCFGGKPDTRHKKPIDEQQQGLDNCEALKLKVCAKGHPMAEM